MNGLVLCGGNSSRLGIPKFTIEKEGLPLYKWWLHTLRTICTNCWISCKPGQRAFIDHSEIIEDQLTDGGPMEGILRAFEVDSKHNWLVVACDLVYVRFNDIQDLASRKDFITDAICFLNPEDGNPFPLLTIYKPSILPALYNEFYNGKRSALQLLLQSNIHKINPEDRNLLKGINTPGEHRNWLNQ